LYYLLEGALTVAEGRALDTRRVVVTPAPTPHAVAADVSSWKGAYDVQFLVEQPSRDIGAVRKDMEEFGADCVLVVGDESVMKVHVHTLHPDQIIRIGLSAGRIADVVVEDLDAMTAEHERATGIIVAAPKPAVDVGVLAVVPGEGFARVAESLGATTMRGGATMNPSTEEILTAIRETNARHVIVLPNDKNVILAAESAKKLAESEVTVIPTRNVGQGMAALVAFDPNKDAEIVLEEMREVADRAHGIEVTRAIRQTTTDGQSVREGEAIALLDGRLVAHGDDDVTVLVEAAKRLSDAEVFTLYSGAGVDATRVEYAAQRLRASCPRAAVEVVAGGQAHYPFIVAAE
jgi:dihydroxyacetone kinase-like predicted kinase